MTCRTAFEVAVVCAVLVIAGGCAGHPPYPKTWPALGGSASGPCERLAGTYTNQGERAQRADLGPVSLVSMLSLVGGEHVAETVTFSFPQRDRLEVVIKGGGDSVSRSLLRRSGQFACEGGRLVIHGNAPWQSGVVVSAPGVPGPVPVVGGESVTFKLDLVEGYLVITRRDSEFMWLPFPARTTWSSWYRFLRVTP